MTHAADIESMASGGSGATLDLRRDIDALRVRGETGSYAALATELGELNGRLKTALREVELAEALELMRSFYPLVFAGMVELGATDPTLRAQLGRTGDITYVLKVDAIDFALCLRIVDGAFAYSFEAPAEPHVTMTTTPEVLLQIMSGQTDAIEAFMMGDVDAEGELTRARGLRSVFETLSDRFGFEIMTFEGMPP